jgi:ABC-type nitrate/sulfonate/bicarbonate transport system permease component
MAEIKMKNLIKQNYLSPVSVFIFLALWQFVSYFELVNPLFIGTPTQILVELVDLFRTGFIYEHLFSSLQALFFGFGLSILVGIFGGILLGTSEKLYRIFSPYVFGLNAIPKVAIMPLIIIWFGIALEAKVAIIFIMAVVPIMVATMDSARSVEPSFVGMAKSFNASKSFITRNITFFYSLPAIFSGIRIALGRAIIGMIIAEFIGLGRGLGYLISYYGATLQTDRLMAVLFVVLVLNFTLLAIIDSIKKHYLSYSYIKNVAK